MTEFVQIHMLTSYPPANLNRDDLGRPKTAVMGGSTRLRISSQSLKRAWRTSDVFQAALQGHIGKRTKVMGVNIYNDLVDKGVSEKDAKKWAKQIAEVFGKPKGANKNNPLEDLEIEQLAHFSPEEESAIDTLTHKLAESKNGPSEEDLKLLRKQHTAADIALFGRMLASKPEFNTEAAAQVAHAISVHKVAVEDDYFTAVDDLNSGDEDMGAAHVGEAELAAGLFYLYLCIDAESLSKNLSSDQDLAKRTLTGLIEAAALVSPKGKQNSFASRARASYILAEKGPQQPRSLAVAFLKPITGNDMLTDAISRLEETRNNMNKVYGDCADGHKTMNAVTAEGSLKEIIQFATE
ncbi:MAG: type I-E CRISPR-associated protein Cas7/Cse4/CasC [Desulfomonilaceae bacterium]